MTPEEYQDFDPRSPLRSYFRMARGALFDPQRFFADVAGLDELLRPALFVAASYAWGAALLSLPVALWLAAEVYGAVFGPSAGGEPAFWLLAVACWPVALALFAVILTLLTFIVALLWHPLVALAVGVGKGSGFGATFRVLAYTSV